MKNLKPPKLLWAAKIEFRLPGRWVPEQTFYLDKPYFPDVARPYNCHVLYETPMEAFLALHKEINMWRKKFKGTYLNIYIYSVKLDLITKGNYFSPEKVKEKELFLFDKCLFNRHLVRQSLIFQRAGNLQISYNKFNKEPILDLYFENDLGKEEYLMTLRKPSVELTYGVWSKFQNKTIEKALFNFDEYPFTKPISFKVHDPKVLEKLNDTKHHMAST